MLVPLSCLRNPMTWSATIAATVPVACAGVLASGYLAFRNLPD
jgi:hypothetical protein